MSSDGVNGKSNGRAHQAKIPHRLFSTQEPPSLSAFASLCSQKISSQDYPLCTTVTSNIPIYDLSNFPLSTTSAATISSLQDEWYHILLSGPGVIVLKNLYSDHSVLSSATDVFSTILTTEANSSTTKKGDHFAASTANARIWNSLGKHCLTNPSSFLAYYSNPWLHHVCEAYLGPSHRLTAQVNIVRPGGLPQVSHRDYHLGFQTAEAVARFPQAVHAASALLTLQGAVAHTDMPLASGPTRFLPFSQQFEEGYVAYRRKEFDDFFLENWVSVPLEAGDGVFFSPALMHAAGANQTVGVQRTANLLQLSSAFGRAMESVDAVSMVERCWEGLRGMVADKGLDDVGVRAVLNAVGDGYPFPTNLDRRPPAPGGMAPESEQDTLLRGLRENWDTERIVAELEQTREDSRA